VKTVIVTVLALLSINSYAEKDVCKPLYEKALKEFNASKFQSVDIKNKKEYQKLKAIVTEIPDRKQVIDAYVASINDENYVLSDIIGYNDINECGLFELQAMVPLFVYVEKNKTDKDLQKDFESFLIPRLKDVRNPALVNFLINKLYAAKRLATLKHGGSSEIAKNFEALYAEFNKKNNTLVVDTEKVINDKNEKKGYSDKQLKEGVLLIRKEIETFNQYTQRYLDLVSKI
jgi:hypothetical protein